MEEQFALEVAVRDGGGHAVLLPESLAVFHGSALSRLLLHPALIVVFRDRLHLPVGSFQHLEHERDPGAIARAAGSVLGYLEDVNPYFLTYRFGSAEGGAMQKGLRELSELDRWASASGLFLSATPVRRYCRQDAPGWIEERAVGEAHAWQPAAGGRWRRGSGDSAVSVWTGASSPLGYLDLRD